MFHVSTLLPYVRDSKQQVNIEMIGQFVLFSFLLINLNYLKSWRENVILAMTLLLLFSRTSTTTRSPILIRLALDLNSSIYLLSLLSTKKITLIGKLNLNDFL